MKQMQFRCSGYQFTPTWQGLLILVICVPLFIKLGLWQYNKAQLRQEIQSSYNSSLENEALALPQLLDNPEAWRYKKVKVTGTYDTTHQIFLDNQVENSLAGFHVVTPLKINHSNHYLLVNRGWVAGGANHNDLPAIETPGGMHEIIGLVWLPSKKIFTLEKNTHSTDWNPVWQHMDMERYQKSVPIQVLPFVIKLDAKSNAGGFVRNWQLPAEKIATNIGYAYQWFGFSMASILIFLFTSIKKTGSTQTKQVMAHDKN
ncbi:MAG: surfeit locus 1 [Betaproteobacteria bacterium HGW-Betaproteobacteria-22]|nr:MAG: surfeit locus 1 [Betaproteobacteria bacterium HGW-Betaproteobacteria-22]